jgi:excinuclease ABC subunit A
MLKNKIIIKGARAHNLKNIDVEIPRDKLVVITGLSGSGKSSLAFDTIYAEGQRRYVESLSAYARQFLGRMDKPDVDYIEGLSPAISIDQKTTSKNPRSTVGTVTEIYDYLRLMFARIGKVHCPKCGRPVSQQTVSQMVDTIMEYPLKTKIQILSPVVTGRKGEHRKLLETIKRNGFVRVRIDNEQYDLSEEINLEKNKKHNIDVVVDRIKIKENIENRLADSIETALKLADGTVKIDVLDQEELIFSEKFACVECGISLEEVTPRTFSFNSPYGACPGCGGLGFNKNVDPELVIPNKDLSLAEGAVVPWSRNKTNNIYRQTLKTVAEHFNFDFNCPLKDLKKEFIDIILYGSKNKKINFSYTNRFGDHRTYSSTFEGVIPNLERRYKESQSDYIRREIEEYMSTHFCQKCKGARLRSEALSVYVGGKNIYEVTCMSVTEAQNFLNTLRFSDREKIIAREVLKEIKERLKFMADVGLEYLTLSRAAGTLSGGEAQRIRLATQIGSSLVGVLYILDEPSIGLHQRDNERLLKTLKHLRDIGNTLIVVEHDEETIKSADFILDVGPGAGANGGKIIASGTLDEIINNSNSITGRYLKGDKKIPVPLIRKTGNNKNIIIKKAGEHNLKEIDVKIPLGVFNCVTGVSGSGKSTLVNDILYKGLASKLTRSKMRPGAHEDILGTEYLEKVINIDQSPIGRTPRSNPATYTGTFDGIREIFSKVTDARVRGYKPGRFSFNVKGGRCEACRGDGIIKIEMHFLPDVYVPCEVCKGKRYNRETLEIKYKGKTIADVLNMTVDEACKFFSTIPKIYRKLKTLQDVGLGYIRLGQPATTLSGGEAQRVKLAAELSRRSNGKTLYILDEPTTGLHMDDINKLLDVLGRLVDNGSTVIVIEHNLDVIKTADYVIDLGPEGGNHGGQIVASGTPEEIVKCSQSYTGEFLKKVLK